MTFAKTFGQRHVLRFLSSHIDLSGCRITAASPVGLRVTDGVHQLCLKSTDGCIQREDNPNSVAPEVIEVYGSTARRTAMTKRGELSRMPRRLTLQQTVELPESLLRHFLSHPLLSDVDVRRLVDTGSVDEDAYMSMLLWFLAAGGDGHRLIFGGCDEVGAYMELTLWHNTAHLNPSSSISAITPVPAMQNERSLLMNTEKLGQIQLPAPEDFDPHPRLLLNGRGIHAGETFHALFPDGWREITIEMSWEPEGPGCWYISTPGFTHICPIGLFVKE